MKVKILIIDKREFKKRKRKKKIKLMKIKIFKKKKIDKKKEQNDTLIKKVDNRIS